MFGFLSLIIVLLAGFSHTVPMDNHCGPVFTENGISDLQIQVFSQKGCILSPFRDLNFVEKQQTPVRYGGNWSPNDKVPFSSFNLSRPLYPFEQLDFSGIGPGLCDNPCGAFKTGSHEEARFMEGTCQDLPNGVTCYRLSRYNT